MIYLQIPPFNPVANGVRSSVQIPRYDMTLARVVLDFPGTNSITKATISEIVLKVGARVVFGPVSGAELDAINRYRGIFDQADKLTIDLTERDGLSLFAKEVGGIDIPALGGEDVFLEVVNNAASGTPTLSALGGFTSLQFDPRAPAPDGQLIHKVIAYSVPTSGGTSITWTPQFKGAIVKRVHFRYTGTDWTALVNGNLNRVEVKKNGVAIHDRVECRINRFIQSEQRKVPQARMYTVDFVHDNINTAALATADARALEFNLTLTAGDTIRAIAEVLDVPGNL
jgi:hypothetical protein